MAAHGIPRLVAYLRVSTSEQAAEGISLLASHTDVSSLLWSRADALRACGRYGEALALIEAGADAHTAGLVAEIHRLSGHVSDATQVAERAIAQHGAAAAASRLVCGI